jgi:hypothetical protein
MAYVPTGLSQKQLTALLDLDPAEIRTIPADRRLELVLSRAEHKAREKEAFWNAVQAFATGALPLLAFFGVSRWQGKRK